MGQDKAFVTLDGRTLLALALELTRSVTPDVRIVGDPAKFAPFAPVVEDMFRGCGPLGGIHAALQGSSAELNLILAVDVPFVPTALLQFLIAQARRVPAAQVTIPRGTQGWQPLCAVYRSQFADAAEKALRQGHYKIDPLFDEEKTLVIGEEDLEAAGFPWKIFRNLNTPEDLEEASREGSSVV